MQEKASATAVDSLDIATVHRRSGSDPSAYVRDVARYLVARGKLRSVHEAHPDVKIYIPRPVGPQEESQATEVEFVGKSPEQVAAARAAVLSSIKEVPPEVFAAVEIDSLAHSHLIGRKGARIRALKDSRGVDVIFPPPGQARSDVLLIYAEQGHPASQAKEALDGTFELSHNARTDPLIRVPAVAAELQRLAAEVANIKSTTLSIPAKLHGHILGPNGTTLNAVIGEARAVHVTVGNGPKGAATAAANGETVDRVLIRGPAEEVARVASDIQRLADEAEQTDTLQSFVSLCDLRRGDASHEGRRSSSSRSTPSTSAM